MFFDDYNDYRRWQYFDDVQVGDSMVTALTDWIRSIIFIVLFASFVEMLLPNSSMQRFVRVVIGLFVMMAVLNPVVDFVQNWGVMQQIPALSMNTATGSGYLPSNSGMAQERERLTREIYRQDLAKQIRALVLATDGVAEAKAVVEISERDDTKYTGQISRIEVFIKPGKPTGTIKPVRVGSAVDNTQTKLDLQLTNKIRQRIAELYQLDIAKIAIKRME